MKRTLILAALLAALTMPAAAAAATLDDLRGLGYRVELASVIARCDNWWVEGFGVATYLYECSPEFQPALDGLADPALHYERRWQHEHPEQLQAAQTLAGRCYAVNRTAPMTDQWTVVGGDTSLTVTGGELPGLAATLPDLHVDGACPAGTGGSQLVPHVAGAGSVTVPGDTATVEQEPVGVGSTGSRWLYAV